MKKRLTIILLCCAILAIATFILLRRADREPRFEGRPLSAWVSDLRVGTGEQKQRAVQVLQAAGPEAAPYLAARLGSKPEFFQRVKSSVRPYLPEALSRPYRGFLQPAGPILDQYAAAEALRVIGTNGVSAVPALGQLLTNNNVLLSVTASRALAQIGPPAVETLTAALDHGDFNVRASACDGLAQLGPASASAGPRLAQILLSETGPIVNSASLALSRIGEPAVPHVAPLLQHTNWIVRRQAAMVLGQMGVAAKPVSSALLEMMKDEHPPVRAAAMDALGRVDPFSPTTMTAAKTALDDSDPSTRHAALQTIRLRPRFVRENMEKIITLLDDPSDVVRGVAALTLTVAPEEAVSAIPKLELLTENTNKVLQANATEALRVIRDRSNK